MADLRLLGDDVPVTDQAAKARARSRLEAVMQGEDVRPRPNIVWRPVAAAAAAILVTLATWTLLDRSIEPPDARRPALLQLATAASSQAAPAVPAGSFVYTRSRVEAVSSDVSVSGEELGSEIITSRRETWIARDGSGLLIERRIGLDAVREERTPGGPGTFRFGDVNELPTDPGALFDAIMGAGFLDGPDDDFAVLSGIGALLRDPFVSPAHREALFRIVASMEGVQVDEEYLDPVGRIGIGVSLRDSSRSVILVFEPGTSRLLAEAESRDGAVIYRASYLESAVVSARGKRPDHVKA